MSKVGRVSFIPLLICKKYQHVFLYFIVVQSRSLVLTQNSASRLIRSVIWIELSR